VEDQSAVYWARRRAENRTPAFTPAPMSPWVARVAKQIEHSQLGASRAEHPETPNPGPQVNQYALTLTYEVSGVEKVEQIALDRTQSAAYSVALQEADGGLIEVSVSLAAEPS